MVGGQSNKVVAIIQARMQSTRLPGKVLMPMPFGGKMSILGQIVNLLKESKYSPHIIIATSVNDADDALVEFAKREGVGYYRGHELDVHSRFFNILSQSNYDTVIRVTADNPLVDIEILDQLISQHQESQCDYTISQNLPIGMNFEVFKAESFLKMRYLELSREEKEHVTLKFRNDKSFSTNIISIKTEINAKLRVTIDYPSDYLAVSTLFQISEKHKIKPSIELIKYANENFPWIFNVNGMNFQKKSFKTINEEVNELKPILQTLEFNKLLKFFNENEI